MVKHILQEKVIQGAVECLQTRTKKFQKRMDPYTLALFAYARTMLEPKGRNTASIIKILAKKAKKDGKQDRNDILISNAQSLHVRRNLS